MRKASREDYDIGGELAGEDELSDVFKDLQIMVKRIQQKDAKMYAALINEQKLLNEQQVMEIRTSEGYGGKSNFCSGTLLSLEFRNT